MVSWAWHVFLGKLDNSSCDGFCQCTAQLEAIDPSHIPWSTFCTALVPSQDTHCFSLSPFRGLSEVQHRELGVPCAPRVRWDVLLHSIPDHLLSLPTAHTLIILITLGCHSWE